MKKAIRNKLASLYLTVGAFFAIFSVKKVINSIDWDEAFNSDSSYDKKQVAKKLKTTATKLEVVE